MSKSVVLVGGAGYIGPVIAADLLANGYKVTCLDALLYENASCVLPLLGNDAFRFVYGDINDANKVWSACEGTSVAVILAGLVGDPITKKYPKESHEINDTGIRACVDALQRSSVERVVFVSTCSNYGLVDDGLFADETFELKPLSSYARSKVEIERYLLSGSAFDFDPVVLRFATAFGLAPRMRFDLTVNEFTRELALGRTLTVFDAQTTRPYCHVRDFARLIRLVIEAPKAVVARQVFNAGGDDNNFTKQQIVDLILARVPTGRVTYQHSGSDRRNYRVNFAKVKNALGFSPRHSVVSGIEELLAAIQQRLFDDVERRPNFHGNYTVTYPNP